MIVYLIKSGICLAIILGIYHLALEREKMHLFNRFFLLFGLAFSFIIPLITIGFDTGVMAEYTFLQTIPGLEAGNINEVQNQSATPLTIDYIQLFIMLYSLIVGIQLIRFIVNLKAILNKVNQNKKATYRGAKLVLIKEEVLPFTFWNYIFVNQKSYTQNGIEAELFTHELTHARQRHSLDILIIEILHVLFWFNPLLQAYKKAIQINHEYLADDQVVRAHQRIPEYQHLLLDKVAWCKKINLASNFNYLVTKKRLTMMTKTTSRVRAIIIASSTLPFLIGMLMLFSDSVAAQQISDKIDVQKVKDELFQHTVFVFEQDNGPDIYKKYHSLTAAEKATVPPPPPAPADHANKLDKPLPKGTFVYLSKDGKVQIKSSADIPPPPPPAPADAIQHMVKKGAIFMKDGKKITSEEAKRIASDLNSNYTIHKEKNDKGTPVIHFKKQ
jgi:beta-lactamase regulating signal transducer with metallopeptidase domain